MAKPYQEGKGWSVRFQVRGQEFYLSGFASQKKAADAAAEKRQNILGEGRQRGLGPHRTSLAQALQDYGREKLPFLKGAAQMANRLNVYLRTAGLNTFKVTKPDPRYATKDGEKTLCSVELVPNEPLRKIPRSLQKKRHERTKRTRHTDRFRAQLARTMVENIRRFDVQEFMTTMQGEKYTAEVKEGGETVEVEYASFKPATIHQERALLRAFFNHAQHVWHWPVRGGNPASGLKMPTVDNERRRILTNAEWRCISAELVKYGNPYVAPVLAVLLDSAMRASEALVQSTWDDVDWNDCVLKLRDAKAGWREVPLNPTSMAVLRELHRRRDPNSSDPRIFPLSYEALKKAWNVACNNAGVTNANIHDLRGTGATRYAIVYHGNMTVLKTITGHKTDAMVNRYVTISARDVARMMHGRALDEDGAPAGMTAAEVAAVVSALPAIPGVNVPPPPPPDNHRPSALSGNVVHVDFRGRAAA